MQQIGFWKIKRKSKEDSNWEEHNDCQNIHLSNYYILRLKFSSILSVALVLIEPRRVRRELRDAKSSFEILNFCGQTELGPRGTISSGWLHYSADSYDLNLSVPWQIPVRNMKEHSKEICYISSLVNTFNFNNLTNNFSSSKWHGLDLECLWRQQKKTFMTAKLTNLQPFLYHESLIHNSSTREFLWLYLCCLA